jgi:hypothetical protein
MIAFYIPAIFHTCQNIQETIGFGWNYYFRQAIYDEFPLKHSDFFHKVFAFFYLATFATSKGNLGASAKRNSPFHSMIHGVFFMILNLFNNSLGRSDFDSSKKYQLA